MSAADAGYLTLRSPLPGAGHALVAILQTSMDEALQGFSGLVAKVLDHRRASPSALAIAAARLVASSVTRPLRQLADAARRIAGGFYGEQVTMAREDEFGLVSHAFNEMQEGIAQREARIVHQARHDGLTGLPNRLALRDRIGVALARSARSKEAGALLLVDIVAFKAINDSLGHDTGDRVLQEISRRLSAQARTADTVARYGGNGFVLLLEDVGEAAVRQAARASWTGSRRAAAPPGSPGAHRPDRWHLPVSRATATMRRPCSAGPRSPCTPRVRPAAPWASTRSARTRITCDGWGCSASSRWPSNRTRWRSTTSRRWTCAPGHVRQAEALVRWMHPARGLIGPDEFISLAEQSGLIGQLTQLVLHKVIRQIRHWSSLGIDLRSQ